MLLREIQLLLERTEAPVIAELEANEPRRAIRAAECFFGMAGIKLTGTIALHRSWLDKRFFAHTRGARALDTEESGVLRT